MSYKVYDGVKINTTDLGVIDAMLKKYSSRVRKIGLELWGKLAIQIATRIFDSHTLWPEKKKLSALHEAMIDIQEKHELLMRGSRQPHYDFDCKVCLYSVGQYVIGFVLAEQKAFKDCFARLKLVEDYCYQNQTDRPEGIPVREWNKRGRDWRKVLNNNNNNPLVYEASSCHTFNFTPYDDIPFEVREVKESLRERAKYYARQIVTDMFYKNKEFDVGGYFRLVATDEYKEHLEKQIEKIEKQLKPEITFEDLTDRKPFVKEEK